MAIYHCSVKIISRSNGRSSVGSSAYRAGEKIKNQNDGETHDYSKRKDVAHTEVLLPENAPEWMSKREKLWNAVEKSEKRKDARTAREIEIAIPAEIDREKQIELVRKYVKENFVSAGMIADFAIHDKGDGNPHAHIMLTTREVTHDGFAGKNREWNDKKLLEKWRENWATLTNEALKREGLSERIDHRTLADQGIGRSPQVHQGAVITAMERRGVVTEVGQLNRDLRELAKIDKKIAELQREAPEAGETHPKKMAESPPKTPDKGDTLGFCGYPTPSDAKKQFKALCDAISAPILAQLEADQRPERERLERSAKKTGELLRAAEGEKKPEKGFFNFGGKHEKAVCEWENRIKEAKKEHAAATAAITEFCEKIKNKTEKILRESEKAINAENPDLVKIIEDDRAKKAEDDEINKLGQYIQGNYSVGTVGFISQVKNAKKLVGIEEKRGLSPEEIAKKHPKIIEIFEKNRAHLERGRGFGR